MRAQRSQCLESPESEVHFGPSCEWMRTSRSFDSATMAVTMLGSIRAGDRRTRTDAVFGWGCDAVVFGA